MILAIIPAQGKSRRLPGKNMREIEGRPLLFWAIEAAKKAKKIDHIIVSTDDTQIAEYATSLGIQTISRGEELCGDAPVMDVYKDVVLKSGLEGITHIVALQPDHPDRTTNIDTAIEIVMKNKMLDFITTDRFGVRHGSVRIMDCEAMLEDHLYHSTGGAWIDNCINIHTERDLNRAQASFLRKNRPMKIGSRSVSSLGPIFILVGMELKEGIHENHQKEMIDRIKKGGADGVVFRHNPGFRYNSEDLILLFQYAKRVGLIPLIPTLNKDDLAININDLQAEAVIIPSENLEDASFLKKAANHNKPIIFSIHDLSQDKIRQAVDTFLETVNRDIILVNRLPSEEFSKPEKGLSKINALRDEFPEAIIGVSGESFLTMNEAVTGAAIALGARIIEIPLSNALKNNIANIRLAGKALGLD